MAFDLGEAVEHPERFKIASAPSVFVRSTEHIGPRISALSAKRRRRMSCDQTKSDSVVLVAMDPACALLHVDRVTGQVPEHDPVAVGMKSQTFLPNPCRSQHEGLGSAANAARSRPVATEVSGILQLCRFTPWQTYWKITSVSSLSCLQSSVWTCRSLVPHRRQHHGRLESEAG